MMVDEREREIGALSYLQLAQRFTLFDSPDSRVVARNPSPARGDAGYLVGWSLDVVR